MSKANYIKIPKKCTANQLANIFEKKAKENSFSQIAISLNKKKNIKGILTLGDFRRILSKFGRQENVNKHLNKSPITVKENELNNKLNSLIEFKKSLKKNLKKIDQIIVVDKQNNITSIRNFSEIENNSNFKEITVVGLGHIGLPLSIYLLKFFSHVNGVDINMKKINDIKRLKLNFYEKNLNQLLYKSLSSKRLMISNDIEKFQSQIYIICLGSEIKKNNSISNISLINLSKKLGKKISKNDLVIMRGTVQVGINRNIFVKNLEKYSKLRCGKDFYFSYMPERIIEGNALQELENVPQIVSGFSEKCKEKAVEFCSKAFKSFIELEKLEEGEIIKLTSNAYRDLSFAFSNEISRISSYYRLSGANLIEKANFGYPRNSIAKPSMGVGGYCLPKDRFLFEKLHNPQHKGYLLAKISKEINNNSVSEVFRKIKKFYFNKIRKKKINILIFGITFKGLPETIDVRNSPSIELANKLSKLNCNIKFYDAMYKELIKTDFDFKKKLINNKNYINKSDIIILANLHESYQKILEENLKFNRSTKNKLIFDCWNLLDKEYIQNLNWHYSNI